MAAPNLEITRDPGQFDLVAPTGVQIDEREGMIEDLTVQNQSMIGAIEKATVVFEKAQAEKDKAIAEIAAKNEKLEAALIAAESRNKELEQLHQAEMKASDKKVDALIETVNSLALRVSSAEANAATLKQRFDSHTHGYVEVCFHKGPYVSVTKSTALPKT